MIVTNVFGERSFSKLKLVKKYLPNSIGDDRMNNLLILSIENDVLEEMKFDESIDKFVTLKYRKAVI